SLAGKGYEAPKSNLPSVFRDMKYADYQQIQFNHDKAYWNNLKTPFKLEFYHQGMYFDTPVKINEVTATAVKRIKYSPDYFTFGDVQHDKDTVKDLGFAGFKDRKSTRLNSSHVSISYAVFCLKKKTTRARMCIT